MNAARDCDASGEKAEDMPTRMKWTVFIVTKGKCRMAAASIGTKCLSYVHTVSQAWPVEQVAVCSMRKLIIMLSVHWSLNGYSPQSI